jgi:hypothetical protein
LSKPKEKQKQCEKGRKEGKVAKSKDGREVSETGEQVEECKRSGGERRGEYKREGWN